MAAYLSSECVSILNTIYTVPNEHGITSLPTETVRKLDKNEAVQQVNVLLRSKCKNVSIPYLDDDFVLRFLHARKMNVDGSFQLIVNYFSFRKNNPTLFENLNAQDALIQNCFHDGLPTVLKNRDRKGRCVLFLLMYQWDHTKYSVETIYRSLMLTMEYLLSDKQNQKFGFVFVVDWTNFTFRDYIDISPKILKLLIDGFQDSFPARIRNVHFIGQPWYVNGLLTVVKPFLKEKTKQKLIIHGSNLSGLHDYIPRDVLTPELGGEGTAYKPDEWIELLNNYASKRADVLYS